MKKTFSLVILMIAISGSHAQKVSLPVPRHKFIVIAHRGDHVLVPENTLAAYENGFKNGVDFVEIDLRTTKDSVLVIMHDATVDRMTNGKGKISDLTYAELKKLQVIGKTKGTTAIYRIPTFEEVLKTCRDKIYIYLDYKDASVQQAYKMIKQYGMEKQIIVYINTPAQYTEWRARFPAMPLMLSLPEDVKTEAQLNKFLKETPIDLLDGDYSDYTPVVLGAVTKKGITAWPDIQGSNEDKNWNHALGMGFTGLQTDHPAALIEYLKNKRLR
jgi:glycerophosphoryl diester phosphodiesterase